MEENTFRVVVDEELRRVFVVTNAKDRADIIENVEFRHDGGQMSSIAAGALAERMSAWVGQAKGSSIASPPVVAEKSTTHADATKSLIGRTIEIAGQIKDVVSDGALEKHGSAWRDKSGRYYTAVGMKGTVLGEYRCGENGHVMFVIAALKNGKCARVPACAFKLAE